MVDAGRAHRVVTCTWAVAVLVHLLGNPAVVYGEALPALDGVVPLLVAGSAAATALRPADRRLAGVAVATVWLLALVRLPVLPNNLVLLAVTGTALLASRVPATALRTVVRAGVAAYLFAALAKYNTAFLDPTVSCAPVLLDRLLGSWGLPMAPTSIRSVVPVVALVTETAVGVGLLVPATRRHAAALGVAFHGLLAYDLGQHFWDFTTALLPLFAAAAPAVAVALADGAARRVRPRVARAAVVVVAVVCASTALPLTPALPILTGHLLWLTGGSALVVAWLLVHLGRRPVGPEWARGPSPWSAVALGLVALVVANGLTPYLQVKTGYGWNMYANLRVVADESNHLVVPPLQLRDAHDDLLAVVDASDEAVAAYDAPLARVQLEDWVVRTADAWVVALDADGVEVELRHGEVVRSTPAWVPLLLPLRPVGDECLLGYGPAG